MNWETFLHRKIKGSLSKYLGIKFVYPSETSKVRNLVLPYCHGKGCDIGFGGDKIKKVDCDGIDFAQPYTHVGKDKVDIACDIINQEIPVESNTYDYVYTSHLIEDFKDTKDGLQKMIRVLKNGGNLILVFPDQPKYEAFCNQIGMPQNPYHIHATMGYNFMLNCLNQISTIKYKILYNSNCEIDYNVIMVLQIEKI